MTSPEQDRIIVGALVASHGIGGCVSADCLSDNPLRFQAGAAFFLADGRKLILEQTPSVHKGRLLLKFRGIDDRNASDTLRGEKLYVDRSEVPPLPEGTWYHFQLLGLKVRENDTVIGEITDILDYTANDIYVVRRPKGGDLLLPALKSVVKAVDLEAGIMDVVIPEGLES